MTVDKGIRIQNIYYMLSYAFKVLQGQGYQQVGCEEFEHTADLMAAILVKGVTSQVKRGLGREYIDRSESLSTVRGKIDINASIKGQLIRKRQLVCDYDEFSIDTTLNQIIKTTVHILLKADITSGRKKELRNLMMYFDEVNILDPHTIDWNIKFHKNNETYQMLINICYLVLHDLLQTDEQGNIKLQKFLDEQRMCRLYEKFILEYYRAHFPHYNVASTQIKWQVSGAAESILLLPTMQSDIMLSTPDGSRTLIIDAKYYTHTMQMQYDKATIHSNNLYQIFTYVKNAVTDYNEVSGMLLYADTMESISLDAEYNMGGNQIYVKTLDLNVDFKRIQAQLDQIATNVLS